MRELCTVGDVVGKLYLPTGYVKANGAEVLREDYPRLVNLAEKYDLWTDDVATYPAMFGRGDGSTTFVLPDWRGVTARFLDDGKGYDVSRILGTFQNDAIRNITGVVNKVVAHDQGGFTASGAFTAGNTSNGEHVNYGNPGGNSFTFNASRVVPTATENRMKNISVLAVIRY